MPLPISNGSGLEKIKGHHLHDWGVFLCLIILSSYQSYFFSRYKAKTLIKGMFCMACFDYVRINLSLGNSVELSLEEGFMAIFAACPISRLLDFPFILA